MRNILVYGTWDLLHIGHINLLKRAKAMAEGGLLIVGVSTDEFNQIKCKRSLYPYEDRRKIVRAIKYVDIVIPENTWEQKANDIEKYQAQLVMGSDWEGKFDEYGCKYLSRTEGISTTVIKDALGVNKNDARAIK